MLLRLLLRRLLLGPLPRVRGATVGYVGVTAVAVCVRVCVSI